MQGLFEFEQDGRYPLRRIPMIMRFNLDTCGIKISLTAWITLSRDEREELVALPCTSPCLLYTSPSPRDQRGSRMPSSA